MMKKYLLMIIACLFLSACDRDDNHVKNDNNLVGIYEGVTYDSNNNALKITAIVNSDADILITFWNHRDKQISYQGRYNNDSNDNNDVLFSNDEFKCTASDEQWSCSDSNYAFTLLKSEKNKPALTQWSGHYQSLSEQGIYSMEINNANKFTISAMNCQSEGVLRLDPKTHTVMLDILNNGCGLNEGLNTLQYHDEHGELFSLEFQHIDPNFPITWIKI